MSTIRVSRKLFAKYRTIQAALQDAPPGSVIEVEPGIYQEDLWIDRFIEIVGLGDRDEVVIQGRRYATVETDMGYAVIKNVTLRQTRTYSSPVVAIHKGTLVLDGCLISAERGVALSIAADEAEPIVRRSIIESKQNVAVLIRSRGKILFEDCKMHSESDIATVLLAEGDPVFRRCTFTGHEGYGVFVEERGKGRFEECNLFGFDQSPAVGVGGGNPTFVGTMIHDGQASGIAIAGGKGFWEECKIFAVGKTAPAIRVLERSLPRFHHCLVKNCPGGAFLFENDAGGIVENCDLFGFVEQAAIRIRTGAHPQFLRSRIHDGDREAIHCSEGGKGILESCELFGFNGDIVTVKTDGKLDLLRCKIYKGQRHGIKMAQKAEGIVKDTDISQFAQAAAICVTQAADPTFVQCRIQDSVIGVEVVENGRGTFEECQFKKIAEQEWRVSEGYPVIRQCQSEDETVNITHEGLETEPLAPLFAEWDSVIGQTQVKRKMRETLYYFDYLQDRKRLGVQVADPLVLHAVFYGPADTGKSEMAECYGRILAKMQLLPQGHVVRIDALELVGANERETRQNTLQAFAMAQGGILYLYNVHKLSAEGEKFGSVRTILEMIRQGVEDENPEFALILSGPEPELKQWLLQFPGLSQRLKNQYVFTEYAPEEMAQLFKRLAAAENYELHPTAHPVLLKEMHRLFQMADSVSQAERVRRYFKKVKFRHGQRCAKIAKEKRTKELLVTLLPEDLLVTDLTEIQPHDPEWMKMLRREWEQSAKTKDER